MALIGAGGGVDGVD